MVTSTYCPEHRWIFRILFVVDRHSLAIQIKHFFRRLSTISPQSVGQGQQSLAFWARDASARQLSTVGRVVPTTSSNNDSYLSSGCRAYDTIFYHLRIDFPDHRSCAHVPLCGARELYVHRRTSIPKQEGHHRYYLGGVLSCAPNA
jgi:hypothetical protein